MLLLSRRFTRPRRRLRLIFSSQLQQQKLLKSLLKPLLKPPLWLRRRNLPGLPWLQLRLHLAKLIQS
jgi:hypothetical protein